MCFCFFKRNERLLFFIYEYNKLGFIGERSGGEIVDVREKGRDIDNVANGILKTGKLK